MAFWSEMWRLDAKIRSFLGLYLITPFCVLSIPVGLFVLWQSTVDFRRLEQQHISVNAVVQAISQTGGRHNRNAVTATFRAADGKSYVSKALYGIEASKHVQPGLSLGVIYERDRPSNNAPSLVYAQGQLHDVKVFLVIMGTLAAILTLLFWRDYAALIKRVWRPERPIAVLA